jgi:hypothetical protein
MAMHVADQDVPVVYNRRFREYGIKILDGGTAVQLITFCPWCGSKLPDSLRDAWFQRLDELKLEPGEAQLPEEMKTDAWWKK